MFYELHSRRATCYSVCSWKVGNLLISIKNYFLFPITAPFLFNVSTEIELSCFCSPRWPMNEDISYVSRLCACMFLQNNPGPPLHHQLMCYHAAGSVELLIGHFTFLLPLFPEGVKV